ncbi:MAG: diacylglycerol kinase family lipid kinase [Rhodospirillaceae bacterium]|nr:diacylglycerol kinase family lipid kinase [Rhodospirillaceae bacterium]
MNGHNLRLLVIFNPTAGPSRSRRFQLTLAALRRLGCKIDISETRRRGDAEEIARGADPNSTDIVVAAGGDGTINEVINGLVDRGIPLALIPLGTANVLASEIGLSRKPMKVAQTIVEGVRRPVCLGRINGHWFSMMAGLGFDAHVVEAVSPPLKRLVGKGAYVFESLMEMIRYRPVRYRLTIDGQAHEAASVIIANGHYYAGRYVVAPGADLHAPILHVCLLQRTGRWQCIRYAVALLMGRLHRLKDVTIVPARNLRLEAPAGEPVQCDGDILGTLPLDVHIAENRLEIVFPRREGAAEPRIVDTSNTADAA